MTDAETEALFLAGYAARYPPARTRAEPTGRRGARLHVDRWLFVDSTRYCPRCLAGDTTSTVQRLHRGGWRRAWRLPVVLACTKHHRYLHHQCANGHLAHHRDHGVLPRWFDHDLHPNQCRASLDDGPRTTGGPACGTSPADSPPMAKPSAVVLRLQRCQRSRSQLSRGADTS